VHEPEGCVTCFGAKFFCASVGYALRCIIRHLFEAEPSPDLREALLNTSYISVLSKLETSRYSSQISDLLVDFLFSLKSLKFTDTEDLYLHHRNIYDRIMRKRIADLPLDFGSIVGLVLAGLHPNIGLLLNSNKYFTHYFPAVEGGLPRIYSTLHFQQLPNSSGSHYKMLLTEFLNDPGRAGEHALDGPKCALVARFLLDLLIAPCSEHNFFRYFDIYRYSDILRETGTLLSKASHSDELLTRINHADIKCEFFTSARLSVSSGYSVEPSLRTLIDGIGDYLTRVLGSVPIDLKITLRLQDRLIYPGVTFGPLYYEGTRTGNV